MQTRQGKLKFMQIPAIFFSRIFPQSASALRADQFSILVEKLRKKRYSLAFDIFSLVESLSGWPNWILIFVEFIYSVKFCARRFLIEN